MYHLTVLRAALATPAPRHAARIATSDEVDEARPVAHLLVVIVKYNITALTYVTELPYSLSLYHVKHPWNCNITRYSLCSFEVADGWNPDHDLCFESELHKVEVASIKITFKTYIWLVSQD